MHSRRLFTLPLLLVLTAFPALAQDPTVEQVLESHYAAIGGLDAWKAVSSMRQTGIMQMSGMEAPFTVVTHRPNKIRIEFEVQGMKGIQAFDGETGWMVMPFMGSPDPQPLPEDAVKAMMAEADFDGVLVDPEAKGHEIELVGKEDVDGTETYRVRVTTSSGVVVDYFLDAEYYLPIQTITKASMQGMEMEITATISDYKEVDGLMIAHSISTANPMGTQVMNVDSIEIDVEVDPETFSMPEVEESSEPEGR